MYLCENSGGYVRMESMEGKVVVEQYDFNFISIKYITKVQN